MDKCLRELFVFQVFQTNVIMTVALYETVMLVAFFLKLFGLLCL